MTTSRGRIYRKVIVAVVVFVKCNLLREFEVFDPQLAASAPKKRKEKDNQIKLNGIKPSIIALDSLTF